ncbi:uncharacterized protein LOC112254663 [Arapaima gigas]
MIAGLRSANIGLNQYLQKRESGSIPPYPLPVTFPVTKVMHVTDLKGLEGIFKDGGFKSGDHSSFSWWSLVVDKEDISAAEEQWLRSHDPPAQLQENQPVLEKFTTSPAFLKSSRFGNFKFTFDLKEILARYSEQFCEGQEPALRVYETVLFKQEIVKVVVIHSPSTTEYQSFPTFEDGARVFREGIMFWRPEAMSETHWYELVRNEGRNEFSATPVPPFSAQFYVWDHLCLAFHVQQGQILQFDSPSLARSLSGCQMDCIRLNQPTVDYEETVEKYKEEEAMKTLSIIGLQGAALHCPHHWSLAVEIHLSLTGNLEHASCSLDLLLSFF